MSKSNDINTALALQTRAYTRAIDRGASHFVGADVADASVRAGNSPPLAALIVSLGGKYGLSPVPVDMLNMAMKAQSAVVQRGLASRSFIQSKMGNIVPIGLQTPTVSGAVTQLVHDIIAFIAQVQQNPSNTQLIQSGLHFIGDIANVYATASTADQAQLDALKGQLITLGIQAGSAAVNAAITAATAPSDSTPSTDPNAGF